MSNPLPMLGLAKKAGALVMGTEQVTLAIRSGKTGLVLAASDVSDNTRKLLTDKTAYKDVPLVFLDHNMEALGKALGKKFVACVALTDNNFIKALQSKLKQ